MLIDEPLTIKDNDEIMIQHPYYRIDNHENLEKGKGLHKSLIAVSQFSLEGLTEKVSGNYIDPILTINFYFINT